LRFEALRPPQRTQGFACGLRRPQSGSSSIPSASTKTNFKATLQAVETFTAAP